MDLHLKGARALVTASSRGLGYAAACGLAQEGVRVAVNGRDLPRLEAAAERIRQETDGEVMAVAGDVVDSAFADMAIARVVEAWDGLDILITNAGGPPSGPFEKFDDEAWQKAVELSLISHVRLIRAAIPYLRQSTCASVLTVTSLSVKQPISNLVLSNSVRAATTGLTKSLALEHASEGIRFNSILPGWTLTDRVRDLLSYRAAQNHTNVDEEVRKLTSEIPLQRLCTPEEFANAVVFLVSPAASYITGLMLTIDGGAYRATF
jgi:3-oxoacyl-[acyl-carrier protein] reductase